ncbi:MAG TPA: PQQ-binding-like beta-propeller repeat protein, partial [Mycobacteriales bacterium]|nr:PQQ-binding-like beta-propeller repeat protein [Mycobacteriales bacterium]
MRLTAIGLALSAVLLAGCSGSSAPRVQPTAGNPVSTSPSSAATSLPAALDWPTYHGTPDRGGAAKTALRGPLHRAWEMHLDAAMYAQPIVAGGVVLAATENNSVYAIDLGTGRLRWRVHLESPARRSDLPCGNIDPSGITGTPAYDAATRSVFVVTEGTDARHTLRALDVASGHQRWQRNVDVAGARDPLAQQERAALLVTAGHVYVAFGGRDGDCGNYVGYVAAVPVTGAGAIAHYAVPTAREAGMWAAAGPVVGPGGDIYVASGNGAEVGGSYDGSDSVIRLSAGLTRKAVFAPRTWRDDNAQDLDLGSMSPAPVDGKIAIAGKRGTVYLLSPDLGGIGGELSHLDGCVGFGGAAVSGTIAVMPC